MKTTPAASGAAPALPEGWKLIAVNQHFEDFMYWVDRAVNKGNANTDIEEAYAAVNWDSVTDWSAALASPQVAPVALRDLHKFLDAAACKGLVLDGVDAVELYERVLPGKYGPDAAAPVQVAPQAEGQSPVAQVVAVDPPGPDGHGVNWLKGKRPKPGALLYATPMQAPAAADDAERECGDGCNGCEACTDYGDAEQQAPAEAGKFDHLAGRGMHELRFDELADYVAGIAWNAVAQREAVSWIVSELERKTNDERVLAVKLDALRGAAADDARDAIRREAFEQAAKEPRAYAEMLEKGGWGNRFPDELCAIFNASTNMAQRIRALADAPAAKPAEPTLPTQGDAK